MVGFELEHLAQIRRLTGEPERVGYCLDTCHLLASGYDLRTPDAYAKTMEQVGAVLGIANVRAFHMNDSKTPLGSKVDRHEVIGKGKLGDAAFWNLTHDARFAKVPGVVETPWEDNAGWAKDVARLRKLAAQARAPKAGLDRFS
jgi:deoxyribonuclease-4